MSIYRYKNCVLVQLWNYHMSPWGDAYPEIQMHAKVVYNIITKQFRLWNDEHWSYGKHFPLAEVTEVSETTRLHVIEAIERQAWLDSSIDNPTGTFDISPDNKSCYAFMVENYVGNPDTRQTALSNQYAMYRLYENENCNPKIRKSEPPKINPYYMLRFGHLLRRECVPA